MYVQPRTSEEAKKDVQAVAAYLWEAQSASPQDRFDGVGFAAAALGDSNFPTHADRVSPTSDDSKMFKSDRTGDAPPSNASSSFDSAPP